MSLKKILFSLAVLGGQSSATPADEPNPNPWIGKRFTFYVWGNDIPGLQLFYLNGQSALTKPHTTFSLHQYPN
jgi:hypothetical protein